MVDVWLYSNEEMLKYEFVEDHYHLTARNDELAETNIDNETKANDAIDNHDAIEIKMEPSIEFDKDTSWMDFFASESKDLDVDEMIIKPIKKEPEANTDDVNHQQENNIEVKNEPVWIQDELKTEPIDYDDSVVANEIPIPNENLDETIPPKTPKRIMKYIDSTTGKIYYLEMDVSLDISKVQEIVINSNGNIKTAKISPIKPVNGHANKVIKKEGESLLRPEIKNLIKFNPKMVNNQYSHIENDHCYISNPKPYIVEKKETVLPDEEIRISAKVEEIDNILEKVQAELSRFTCVRMAVCHLLTRIPLISKIYQKYLPFVVPTEEKYWTFDIVKRRNIEVCITTCLNFSRKNY